MSNPQLDLLTNNQYQFSINNFPNVSWHVQSTNLPAVTLSSPILHLPKGQVSVGGTKLEYDPLTVVFLIDEDMSAYTETFKWMVASRDAPNLQDKFSDGTLSILTGQMNKNIEFVFVGLMPTFLSDIQFVADDTDSVRTEATVTFAYQYFYPKSIEEHVGTR